MHTELERIGKNIAAERVRAGLNQKQFGDMLGFTQKHISFIEGGKVENLKISTILHICKLLNISTDKLFL